MIGVESGTSGIIDPFGSVAKYVRFAGVMICTKFSTKDRHSAADSPIRARVRYMLRCRRSRRWLSISAAMADAREIGGVCAGFSEGFWPVVCFAGRSFVGMTANITLPNCPLHKKIIVFWFLRF